MVNGEGFEVKIAAIEDSSVIIKMLKQLAQWMKEHEINQWQYLLDGGDDEEIKQAIVNQETYIVLKDKEIIATFSLSSKQSEWDRQLWGSDNTLTSLYLHRLAIIPAYMKKGIGKSILIWIQEYVSDKELLKLDCVAANVKLNNFYKCNGFEFIGVTDGHSKYQKLIKK
ncbi:GNAT superfamily N-acetyltransferase [Solibacillus kalamii]|uniref:GNAT family N-acetyltransferase n=1 Tax=Solibacillus kalamii TaxID=1748298 RepID=A0ABX3ZHF1_9BACL|nr:GNAT family N-acetyltransferase [Solibacillus kalamii]MBM7663631.1 GNAT superfamily N-acetyltransferase [Solibacillus kalamii]OUZ39111.1 GNAT family N-acetyltransferase [Solibacillus kalamii]